MAFVINLDVYDVRAAADRAILDVLLARPRRQVDGHDDLLAAGVADVAGLVLHFPPVPPGRSPFLWRAHLHGCLRHQLDLAGVIDFDVGPVVPADHHPTNPDGLALVVCGRVVDPRRTELRPSVFGDDDAQVLRVTVVRLGVQEHLPGTRAAFRSPDDHFHDHGLVDPADGFGGGHRTLLF